MNFNWDMTLIVIHDYNNIVLAIAEKCEVFLPGCYDAAAYED